MWGSSVQCRHRSRHVETANFIPHVVDEPCFSFILTMTLCVKTSCDYSHFQITKITLQCLTVPFFRPYVKPFLPVQRCAKRLKSCCWIVSANPSVERSLLPWAIFLIFTRNRPWKSEDHLCTLFFIELSREKLEKSERTPPVSWHPWALTYSRDRPYNFSCLSAVSKNRRFSSFFSALGVIWRGKAFRDQQCQFLPRNKSLSSENESNCSMTSECVRTDSILPRGAGLEHGQCKQLIFSLSTWGILVERLSF